MNLNDLLRQRTVERERIEYKAGWNTDLIICTVCTFADDFENLGGGYVVIGQDPPLSRYMSFLTLWLLRFQRAKPWRSGRNPCSTPRW